MVTVACRIVSVLPSIPTLTSLASSGKSFSGKSVIRNDWMTWIHHFIIKLTMRAQNRRPNVILSIDTDIYIYFLFFFFLLFDGLLSRRSRFFFSFVVVRLFHAPWTINFIEYKDQIWAKTKERERKERTHERAKSETINCEVSCPFGLSHLCRAPGTHSWTNIYT